MSYAPQQRANLPSRTGPVILIVAGALAMILGPIIGIVMSVSNLFGSLDLNDFANAQQISNGGTADLTANSEWMVVPDSATSQGYSCDVTGTNGEMVDTRSREGIVLFTSTGAGAYTISCDPGGATLVVLPAANIDEIIESAPDAFSSAAIGFLAGFLGFIALIVGIIWLVRVNRDRRAAGGGGYPPPGYGQGGYGQGGYGQGGYGQGGQGGSGGWGQGGGQYTPPSGSQQWGQGYPPPPGQAGQSGQSGQPGQQPPRDPWSSGGQQQYGQRPTDPPRYGERIDPQDPPS